MQQFGSFYAKTHFSKLLDSVTKGKKILISKRGTVIAILTPYTETKETVESDGISSAIRAIKNLRKEIKLGPDLSIKQMKSQGRS